MNKWLEALGWREVQAALGLAVVTALQDFFTHNDWRHALLAGAAVLTGGGGIAVIFRKLADAAGKLASAWIASKLPAPKN